MITDTEGNVIDIKGHTIKVKTTATPRDGSRPVKVEVHPRGSSAIEVFEGPNAMSSAEDAIAGLCGEWKGKPKTMPWSHLKQ